MPEEIIGYIKFLRDKNVSLVQEEKGVNQQQDDVGQSKETESIGNFSLAELLLFRKGRNTALDITLTSLEEGIKKNRSQENSQLVEEQKSVIESVIKSQPPDVWVREAIQNSRDAARKKMETAVFGHSEKRKQELRTIEIVHSMRKTQEGEKNYCDFVIAILDHVGMDGLSDILNHLLVPTSSDPHKQALGLTGKFGIGFFTVFSKADFVEIRTGKKGGMFEASYCYEIRMEVIRNASGEVEDIQVKNFNKRQGDPQGTAVRCITRYKKSEALYGQLEGLFLKNKILKLVGGMVAKVHTYQNGTKISLPSKNPFQIFYNRGERIPLGPVHRELIAAVPVSASQEYLGEIKIYMQQGGSSQVAQKGLYVSRMKSDWIKRVPPLFREIVDKMSGATIIELPEGVELTGSRDGVASAHYDAVHKGMFVAFMHACLYLYTQRNIDITALPRDFFDTIEHNRHVQDGIREHAELINQYLEPKSVHIGQWDHLPTEMIDYYLHPHQGRMRCVNLLTRIKYRGQTLEAIVSQKATITGSEEFMQRQAKASDKRAVEKKTKDALMKIGPESDLTPSQKKLALVVRWLYKITGQGFYDIVYFHQEKDVLATAGSASLKKDGTIAWKLRINTAAGSSLPQWEKFLESGQIWDLIYHSQRGTFFEIIAHEYAHVLEFQQHLEECLEALRRLGLPKEQYQTCERLIKQHFVSMFNSDDGVINKGKPTFINQLKRKFKKVKGHIEDKEFIIRKMQNRYDIQFDWSHDVDENMDTSFVNLMRAVIEKWVRCEQLNALPSTIEISNLLLAHQEIPKEIIIQLFDHAIAIIQCQERGQRPTTYPDFPSNIPQKYKCLCDALNELLKKREPQKTASSVTQAKHAVLFRQPEPLSLTSEVDPIVGANNHSP